MSGPTTRYHVTGGSFQSLGGSGFGAVTSCLASDLPQPSYYGARPDPPAGKGYYYVV